MSDYYFIRENQALPMYVAPDDYISSIPSMIFTYPKHPVPIVAKYKPDVDYLIPEIIIWPEFSVSKSLYEKLKLENIYGSNWIPINLIDQGQHNFMMMQLAHEVDVISHDLSDYKRFKRDRITGMRKIVLDPEKISKIPLYKRLIFRDKVWGFHIFFHKSIVDIIIKDSPSGVEFIPVEQFDYTWAG